MKHQMWHRKFLANKLNMVVGEKLYTKRHINNDIQFMNLCLCTSIYLFGCRKCKVGLLDYSLDSSSTLPQIHNATCSFCCLFYYAVGPPPVPTPPVTTTWGCWLGLLATGSVSQPTACADSLGTGVGYKRAKKINRGLAGTRGGYA
jgi:hypothetical protein